MSCDFCLDGKVTEPVAYHGDVVSNVEYPCPRCNPTCRFCGVAILQSGFCSSNCLSLSHSPIQVFDPVYGVEVQFLPPLRGWRVGDFRGQRVNGVQVDIKIEPLGLVWRRIERVGE